MTFGLALEGKPRPLPPSLQHEICRTACEVLRNAFGHPCARQIEVEIRYDARQLRLRFRDDGEGTAPNNLEGDGYRELRDISEHAKRIGARLDIWSAVESGTEVELAVPARIAYATSHRYNRHRHAGELNVRLEERANERTRIARDLHDTLLQNFHGLMIHFQAAYNLFPERPSEGMKTAERYRPCRDGDHGMQGHHTGVAFAQRRDQ